MESEKVIFFWKKILPNPLTTWLEERHELRKIVGNTAWLFADRGLRMVVGLAVGIWLVRYLGPEKFGVLSYAQAFVAIFTAVATLGLDTIVVRDLVNRPSSSRDILGTVFIFRLLTGFFLFVSAVGIVGLVRPLDYQVRWMVGIIAMGLVFQPFDVIDLHFQSEVRSKNTIYAKCSAFLLVSFGKVILILEGAPLIAFAWTALVETFIGAVGLVLVYRWNRKCPLQWRMVAAAGFRLCKEGLPMLLSSIVVILYMRIDQVMLGELRGSEEVGIYAAAVKLAELWYLVPVLVTSSAFPAIIKSKAISTEVFEKRLQYLYDFVSSGSILFATFVTLFSSQIVSLLYGVNYSESGPVLALLGWSGIFIGMSVSRSKYIVAEGLVKYMLVTQLSGTIVNIALNFILLPRYGAYGAALSTLVAYAFAGYLSSFLFRPLFKSGLMLTKSMFAIFRLKTYYLQIKKG